MVLNAVKRDHAKQNRHDVPELLRFHLQSSGIKVSYFVFSGSQALCLLNFRLQDIN